MCAILMINKGYSGINTPCLVLIFCDICHCSLTILPVQLYSAVYTWPGHQSVVQRLHKELQHCTVLKYWFNIIQYYARSNNILNNIIQYYTISNNIIQYNMILCNIMQYYTLLCNTRLISIVSKPIRIIFILFLSNSSLSPRRH